MDQVGNQAASPVQGKCKSHRPGPQKEYIRRPHPPVIPYPGLSRVWENSLATESTSAPSSHLKGGWALLRPPPGRWGGGGAARATLCPFLKLR